jgi:hypothetical protein
MPETIKMYRVITIIYFHPKYSIGLEDVRNAWLIEKDKEPVKLKTIIYQGQLVYRLPVSGKRISYRSIKKELIKKTILLKQPFDLLPF